MQEGRKVGRKSISLSGSLDCSFWRKHNASTLGQDRYFLRFAIHAMLELEFSLGSQRLKAMMRLNLSIIGVGKPTSLMKFNSYCTIQGGPTKLNSGN